MTFRRATAKDAEEFYGAAPARSFRGWVAELDGVVLGVGGVYYDEHRRPVVFSEMSPEMELYKRSKVKAVRLLVDFAQELAPRVYAVSDPRYETSGPLLEKLGFVPTGEMTEIGELLVRERR